MTCFVSLSTLVFQSNINDDFNLVEYFGFEFSNHLNQRVCFDHRLKIIFLISSVIK